MLAGRYFTTMAALAAAAVPPAAIAQDRLVSGGTWAPPRAVSAPGANGAILLDGSVARARIGPATVRDAYRAVETSPGAVAEDVTIAGLTASNLQRDGIRLRVANRVTISDFHLRMRAEPQSGRNLPEGIAIFAGRDITIRDGEVAGFRMVQKPGRYTNGDGMATEGEVDGLTIARVRSSDNSDGGFDLKGSNLRLDALVAERNGRGFRFWGQARAGTLTSNDSRSAAFWFGRGADVRIARIVVRSSTTAPILLLDGAKRVEIGACDLKVPAGTRLARSDSSGTELVLGPTCRL